MPRYKSVTLTWQPDRRGGARPGAGAPRGNLNALKHGRYSPRYLRGLLVLHLLPELAETLAAISHNTRPGSRWRLRRPRDPYRDTLNQALRLAATAAERDPLLADSIKKIVRDRLYRAAGQIQAAPKTPPKQKQSNVSDSRAQAWPGPPTPKARSLSHLAAARS